VQIPIRLRVVSVFGRKPLLCRKPILYTPPERRISRSADIRRAYVWFRLPSNQPGFFRQAMRQASSRGLYTQIYRQNPNSNSDASIAGFGIAFGFRFEPPLGVPVNVPLFLAAGAAARLPAAVSGAPNLISFFYFSSKSALHGGDDT